MAIVQSLCALALQQVTGENAKGLVEVFSKHFSDHGQRILRAFHAANERAWRTLEIALAGDSWWNRVKTTLTNKEDQVFSQHIRAFLDAVPLTHLAGKNQFRKLCLQELQQARARKLFVEGPPDQPFLLQQANRLTQSNPQAILQAQGHTLQRVVQGIRDAGYKQLAALIDLRPENSTPLIIIAVRYFFRRAVEQDAELAHGLTFSQLEQLNEQQRHGFQRLDAVMAEQRQRLETLLADLGQTVQVVAQQTQETNQRIQALQQQIDRLLQHLQMQHRELRPRDSLSIRSDDERRRVKELVALYRALPEDRQRQAPELLNSLGMLQVASGDFVAARRDFQQVARLQQEPPARAVAHYNAYRAALEQKDWDGALGELLNALKLDPQRFAPFPVGRFRPQRILGAGGFGVAFLCQHKYMDTPLVVKALLLENQDHDPTEVFSEARILSQLDDPAFVRIWDCGYVDAANKSRAFLVMDYFDGIPLDQFVRDFGLLSVNELKALLLPVARALESAHHKKILHRDIKPANLLVRKDDDGFGVKLIDFGLAMKHNVLNNTTHLPEDQSGSSTGIAGTLDYAAPEQLGTLPGIAVGPHSDVYSFGKLA